MIRMSPAQGTSPKETVGAASGPLGRCHSHPGSFKGEHGRETPWLGGETDRKWQWGVQSCALESRGRKIVILKAA